MVGGTGGETMSQFASQGGQFTDDITTFISEEIPRQVVVQPTSQFLVSRPTPDVSVPLIFDAKLTTSKTLPFGGLVKTTSGLEIIQRPQLETKTRLISQVKLQPQLEQVKVLEQVKLLQQPQLKLQQKQILQQKVLQKVQQKLQQKVLQKQQQRTRQELLETQAQQILQPQKPEFKTPRIIVPPEIPTLGLGKALEKVKGMKPQDFEAIGFRFGKEVSLKKGTQEETSKALSGFLKKTLGASGFLKKATGEKLRAEETGLLKEFGFRKSKVSPFLVVEKKERRLKRGTQETTEIQYFRKKPSKSKGRKSPFGL